MSTFASVPAAQSTSSSTPRIAALDADQLCVGCHRVRKVIGHFAQCLPESGLVHDVAIDRQRGHCATERLPNEADFYMFAANLQNCLTARPGVLVPYPLHRGSVASVVHLRRSTISRNAQSMSSPHSVVVVDGNARDRTSTVTLLEAAGYRVRSARSFDEAKTLLAAECPDLLITDLRLGQYNGLHLVLRTRNDLSRRWRRSSPAGWPTPCSRPKRSGSTPSSSCRR